MRNERKTNLFFPLKPPTLAQNQVLWDTAVFLLPAWFYSYYIIYQCKRKKRREPVKVTDTGKK
jgi:cytochrome c-type biogenesis protein CcmH/NrfF